MKTKSSFNLFKTVSFVRVLACAALFAITGSQKLRAYDQGHDRNLPWDFNAITTVIWSQTDPSDPQDTTEIHIGSGHSSHLGAVSVVVVDEVDEVVDPNIGPALSITGQATLVGSDGSSLTFSLDTLVPYNPPTFPFHATITITGGTGKLSGVTGTGEADGYVDESGRFHFAATGSLTKPGK
jgi:hypothetical protein